MGEFTIFPVARQCCLFTSTTAPPSSGCSSNGIEVTLITGRESPMVTERARELGIRHVFQRAEDKLETLKGLAAELSLRAEECAYVGDDWPDLEVLGWVGLPIAPADAQPEARAAAELVTDSAGGRGVAAEVCRLLLELRES